MKKNMGNIDRIARFSIAIIIGLLYYFGMISGLVATVLLILSAIFIITSFISFCPLYFPFGLSTRGKKKE